MITIDGETMMAALHCLHEDEDDGNTYWWCPYTQYLDL